MDKNLIIGVHAIRAAVANPERRDFELIMTEEGRKELGATLSNRDEIQYSVLNRHHFQEKVKQIYRELGLEYHRVTGGAALLCSAIRIKTPDNLYQLCKSREKLKIVILDGVTDVHNAGAIVRTASFYNTDVILVGGNSHSE